MKQELRNKDTGTFLEKYRKSFFHAIDGIIYAIKYEQNMIVILVSILVVVIFGLILSINIMEWLFIILMIGLVMGCEMINTSIEALVDLKTLEKHPLAKIAKDTASGATLIFCLTAFSGGLVIFIPKIMMYLK